MEGPRSRRRHGPDSDPERGTIMVRSVAVGFGAVTMLALAGSAVLGGQGALGMKHRAAAPSPVEVIQDRPASAVATAVAPVKFAPRVGSTPSSSRARAHTYPAASPAPRPQAASGPLGQSVGINQLLQLAQSPAIANVLPTGATTSGGALLPSILQQVTDPVATPAPAAAVQPVQGPTSVAPASVAPSQPELVDAAVTHANNGSGKDAGDAQK
jgi:hypothetical protein